jgi:hypothetical protein
MTPEPMPETQPNLDSITALELWSMLKQPGVLHYQILRGLLPLSRMQALHIAGATDYDWIKAELKTALAELEAALAEAAASDRRYKAFLQDWADAERHIRGAAKKVIPAAVVDGDRFSVPGFEDIFDYVVSESEQLRADNARLREALGQYADHTKRAIASNETPTTRTPGSWRNAIGVLELSGDDSDGDANETPTA